MISLTDTDIARIAEAVVQRIKAPAVAVTDPWLTREQAAGHCGISTRAFDRLREAHPEALASASTDILRFSRNALDVFKATGGVQVVRPGRPRKAE